MNVGIGEYKIRKTQISSIGLGSCVAFILYDRRLKMGGLAHVMLPESNGKNERPGKFADTAVPPHLVSEMEKHGSSRRNMSAYLVGGASMFQQFKENLDIGNRNIIALKKHLNEMNIPIESEDTGGKSGRSVFFSRKREEK